jgi:O-antigen/teichoic acid export membrane protein
MRIGDQAAILTLSRLASFGLMLLGPLLLVRLVPIEEFGRYREFVLYASMLQSLATFAIPDSLLYFIPAHPQSPWRIVHQTAVLMALSSVLVVGCLVAADLISGGVLVGPYLLPLAIYTLFLVNLDFWEFLLIALRRPRDVMIYTALRLASRMIVAVGAAALTHSVAVIIWSLVVLEGLRVLIAAFFWRAMDRSATEPPIDGGWRNQLRFCLPTGLSMLLAMARRNIATVAVVRLLGPASLAQFSIGKYGEPIIATVRNSLSSVILPEMVRREEGGAAASLVLWKRATAICAIVLFPIVPVVLRYAEPLVVTLFGDEYLGAAVVMQLYMLVVIRECFDFSPALRARARTSPLVYGTLAGLVAAVVVLYPLIKSAGIAGAMGSFVIGSFVEAIWLAVTVMALYGVGVRELLPWQSLGKVVLASALASICIVSSWWTDALGFAGIIVASGAFFGVYVLLVRLLRIPESEVLFAWVARFMQKAQRVN